MDCVTEITDPWEWQTTCKILDDCFNDVPGCLWNDEKAGLHHVSFVCDDPVTPSQGSKEVSILGDDSEEFEIVDDKPEEASSRLKKRNVGMVDDILEDPSPRFKRRKLLHYKSDSSRLGAMPVTNLRSQSVACPVEEELLEQSDWNLQCPEDELVAGCETLDQSSEAWLSSLIDDQADINAPEQNEDVQIVDEVPICTNERTAPEQNEDVQIVDEVPICTNERTAPEQNEDVQIVDEVPICANESIPFPPVQIERAPARNTPNRAVPSLSSQKHRVRTSKMPVKVKKLAVKSLTRTRSFIAYPFTFIKPSAIAGEVTLEDINRQLLSPPVSALQHKEEEEDLSLYPTSAFSGKPVVGATTIRTEGGKGAITILRTKG